MLSAFVKLWRRCLWIGSALSRSVVFVILALWHWIVWLSNLLGALIREFLSNFIGLTSDPFSKELPQKLSGARVQNPLSENPIETFVYRKLPLPKLPSVLTPSGKNQLKDTLLKIRESGVTRIYLIHGTFVGDDPAHLIAGIQKMFPRLPAAVRTTLHRAALAQSNLLHKDRGLFSEQYEKILNESRPPDLSVERFFWSSGNHHLARLQGTLRLLENLKSKQQSESNGVAFFCHSHGGQLLALMSQIMAEQTLREKGLNDSEDSCRILKFLEKHGMEAPHLLKRNFYSFLLGTPKRYNWILSPNWHVCSVVNHRGEAEQKISFSGFLRTLQGDSVQQWGVEGTDIFPPLEEERALNSELAALLGESRTSPAKAQFFRHRLHPNVANLLVDFGDQSAGTPNFFATGLGHTCYTQVANMLPLLQLALEEIRENQIP